MSEHEEALMEWREYIGQQIMFAMACLHDAADFGDGAVCATCFANTQKIGRLIEAAAANAWDQGRAAERRDWELTADLATPDEDRKPLLNPYRVPADLRAGANEGEGA